MDMDTAIVNSISSSLSPQRLYSKVLEAPLAVLHIVPCSLRHATFFLLALSLGSKHADLVVASREIRDNWHLQLGDRITIRENEPLGGGDYQAVTGEPAQKLIDDHELERYLEDGWR